MYYNKYNNIHFLETLFTPYLPVCVWIHKSLLEYNKYELLKLFYYLILTLFPHFEASQMNNAKLQSIFSIPTL